MSYDNKDKKFHLSLDCSGSIVESLPNWNGQTAISEGPFTLDAQENNAGVEACTVWEETPTILVIDPRHEYLR